MEDFVKTEYTEDEFRALLQQQPELVHQSIRGETMLWKVCWLRDVMKARVLIEAGADLNQRYQSEDPGHRYLDGKTLLHIVTDWRCSNDEEVENVVRMARFLVTEAGVDPNIADNDMKETAVYGFAAQYFLPVLNCLIDLGTDLTVTNRHGWTPLHNAVAAHGSTDVIERLAQHPTVNIDAQSRNGDTALHRAVYERNMGIVEVLMRAGADPHIPNYHDGKTAWEVAQDAQHWWGGKGLQGYMWWTPERTHEYSGWMQNSLYAFFLAWEKRDWNLPIEMMDLIAEYIASPGIPDE